MINFTLKGDVIKIDQFSNEEKLFDWKELFEVHHGEIPKHGSHPLHQYIKCFYNNSSFFLLFFSSPV